MDIAEVLLRRWRATGLPTSTPGLAAATAPDEVARLGAVQAQDFEPTLWSLGRRTGQTRAQVLAGFEAGEFLRTHALRQTWHAVHRDDLLAVQAATAHRVQQANAQLYRLYDLDEPTRERAGSVIAQAVAEEPLTRAQVGQRLSGAGLDVAASRLGFLMMWAELECLVASGPMAGKQHTYAPAPRGRAPDRAEATRWLAERFFSSHGPASLADFTAWSSLTLTEARAAVATLPVSRATVDGVECLWIGDAGRDPWVGPQVELLNGYDEYISGLSAAGKRWLDRAGLARVRAGTPVGVVTADGQLIGHWRRTAARGAVRLDVLALRTLRPDERASLDRCVERYGRFLGDPVEVAVRSD